MDHIFRSKRGAFFLDIRELIVERSGSMSAVPAAGYDPIFWAHHTMIDRLWRLWQMAHPGVDPGADLLDTILTPFAMTVADTLNVSALGYDYAVEMTVWEA